jgi:serine/threonine-protein kinase RsbW
MSKEMVRLKLPARTVELANFCAFVRSGVVAVLPLEDLDRLELVLEELFMNVARHAYKPDEGDIEVGYVIESPGRLVLEICDTGRAFNPLAADPPDLTRNLSDRPLGGMGIPLVRALTESMQYAREGDRNKLTFAFPASNPARI